MAPNARVNYLAQCWGPDGLKWEDRSHNTVTTAGKNYLLATGLAGGTAITAWYLGLKGTGAATVLDSLSSHVAWSEISTVYVATTRSVWTGGTAASGSIDNSAATAAFSIKTTATVYGAFLADQPATSTSTGKLYSAADFAASRSVASSDTLNIVATFTIS